MYYDLKKYLKDLENLRDLLVKIVEEFYSRVFGVSLNPRIEIYTVPTRNLLYENRTIYAPFTYLAKLKEDLKNRNLNGVVDSLSSLFHETVHYSFDVTNKKDEEYHKMFANEGLAEVLYLFYSKIGEGVKIGDGLTLDSLLFMINDEVIKGFLDKRKLEEVEKGIIESVNPYMEMVRSLLSRINGYELLGELKEVYFNKKEIEGFSRELIYRIPAYLIIKEFGINEYMNDLRDVILNPEKKERILEKYYEAIKNNYVSIFLSSSAVSSGGLDIMNSP